MPFYDIRCRECGDQEIFMKMSEVDMDIACPECDGPAFMLISAPSVQGEPTTVGAVADKNTKKMGHYELEDRKRLDGSEAKNKMRAEQRRQHKLATMTPKQKEDYIYKGIEP